MAGLLERVPWAHTSGPYRALDLTFGVRTCDPDLGSYLDTVFRPFATQGSSGDVCWFSALDPPGGGDGLRRAYAGDRRVAATPLRSVMLASLLWAFNREVVARAQGCLLLHASAVERDGVIVVLPSPQNSGKTTLCAALLRHGYRYVTDEAVAVDIATGQVRPFPKALSLDTGSWPLFPDLAPQLTPGEAAYLRDQWHLPAAALGAEIADVASAVPRVLLSPRHETGAEGRISRLRPSEGLLLLVENSFNTLRWGQDGLTAAARLVHGCSVVGRLLVGDLGQACAIVDRVVDEALTTQPQKVRA